MCHSDKFLKERKYITLYLNFEELPYSFLYRLHHFKFPPSGHLDPHECFYFLDGILRSIKANNFDKIQIIFLLLCFSLLVSYLRILYQIQGHEYFTLFFLWVLKFYLLCLAFWSILVKYCTWCYVNVQLLSSACGYPAVPTPDEENILSLFLAPF